MLQVLYSTAALLLLAACAPEGSEGQAPADRGARLYAMHCLSCHQRDGRGLGDAQPALVGSATLAGDPEPLVRWVLLGKRPAGLPARRSVVVMPQFTWLSDEDLAAVLNYSRSQFVQAPPLSAEDVARVRATHRP